MHEKSPRNIWWVFVSILGTSALGWFVNTFSPSSIYSIGLFFLFVFVSSFFLFLFVFNNVRQSVLLTTGLTVFLILRTMRLYEWFYIALLAASLISLELYLQKR